MLRSAKTINGKCDMVNHKKPTNHTYNTIETSIALKSSGNPSSVAHQNRRVRQFLVSLLIPVVNSWIGTLRR